MKPDHSFRFSKVFSKVNANFLLLLSVRQPPSRHCFCNRHKYESRREVGDDISEINTDLSFRRAHEKDILQYYMDLMKKISHEFKKEFPIDSVEKVS